MFSGDRSGYLKKFDLITKKKYDIDEKIFDCSITATCLTKKEEHFFAGANNGIVSEFNVEKSIWVYNFNGSNNNSKITNLACTNNSKFLFCIDEYGH